ncbi:MAG: hypothetical protein IJ899_16800 [Blautia sp.]|nr:hypothetical protein [Blautia sp.]
MIQREMHSDDMRKAVQETIRICREKDVLRDYLKGEEAAAVMFAFADQEKEFNKALRTERREGISIGEARGEARGAIKEAIRMYTEELELMPSEIVKRIMTRFSLKKDEAENYLKEVTGLSPK